MSDILVITCPGSKQCSHLVPRLYRQGTYALRLGAHTLASARKLKTLFPRAEIVVIDLASFDDCKRLLRGASAIHAVLPSLHHQEKEIGINLVDAAVFESGRRGNVFKHFVLSSVFCTQHRALLQNDLKSFVEERLFLSPLNWTILKPANYMDIYPVKKLATESNPVLVTRWDPARENSLIALSDLADATCKVLHEREQHYHAEYCLCSTLPISEAEIAEIISDRIGKTVQVRYPGHETSISHLKEFLFDGSGRNSNLHSEIVLNTVERLITYYNRRGLRGSPNILRFLLGREPTSVDEWISAQLNQT